MSKLKLICYNINNIKIVTVTSYYIITRLQEICQWTYQKEVFLKNVD